MKNFKSAAIIAFFGVAALLSLITSDVHAAPMAMETLGSGIEDNEGSSRLDTEAKIIQIVEKISRITQVFIYLIGLFFVVRMLLIIFNSQIDLAGGKPGAIADLASEMVYTLLSFLIAVEMPNLAQAFAMIAMKSAGTATGTDIGAMGGIIEPIAGFLIGLLGTLVFVSFIVNFVYAGVQSVVSSAIGSPGGVSSAISTGLSLIFTLLIGFAFLRAGQWIFQNNFQF